MSEKLSVCGHRRKSKMVEIPVVRSLAALKQQAQGVAARVDPAAVWHNLTILDPRPPGPLAKPPYVLALPDEGMDGDLFLREAMRLYRRRSNYRTVEQAFRPIPRFVAADDITFVVPVVGMDECAFADFAVRVRLTLEEECRTCRSVDQAVWA
jgi:hypothetical protein